MFFLKGIQGTTDQRGDITSDHSDRRSVKHLTWNKSRLMPLSLGDIGERVPFSKLNVGDKRSFFNQAVFFRTYLLHDGAHSEQS